MNLLSAITAVLLAALFTTSSAFDGNAADSPSAAAQHVGLQLRGVHFVPNQGQWSDASVHHGFRTRGLDVAFRESSLTMHMQREVSTESASADTVRDDFVRSIERGPGNPMEYESIMLEITFPGSNAVTPRGDTPHEASFNYFIGDDQNEWRADVPSFGEVVYEDLYDGIDLLVCGDDDGILKYEFHCEPGSDHTQVRIRYDGIDSMSIDDAGDLLIETAFGTLRDGAPVVWQEADDNLHIPAHFEALDAHTYTIALTGAIDPSLPLVLDPEVDWMTYLGGSDRDLGRSLAVDSAGNSLITGGTDSLDFEGRNNDNHGGQDTFIAKVNPSGGLEWMTYLGGSQSEFAYNIAVDGADNAFISGVTRSTDFGGRTNLHHGGDGDGFIATVDSSGVLRWMTYLGGSGHDECLGVSVDNAGDVLVAGYSGSIDFEGRNNSYHGGEFDAFALKVSAAGELQWMTYVGGTGSEFGVTAVSADVSGDVLVAGDSDSIDFEGRNNSYHGGFNDSFALKVTEAGEIEWMTYLGGTGRDFGWQGAVDSAGNLLMAGFSNSSDFEGRNNSYHGGSWDGYVAKVGPAGDTQWMTYVGGTALDNSQALATDDAGNAFVAGDTKSSDFEGRSNSHRGGIRDGFCVKVSPSGQLQWMTYIGGGGEDVAFGIALNDEGNLLLAGTTDSTDFEARNNSYHGGPLDAFVLELRPEFSATLTDFTVVTGTTLDGVLADLLDSDDVYVHTLSGFGQTLVDLHNMEMTVSALTAVDSAISLRVLIESRIDEPSGIAQIRMYNWNTTNFDVVGSYSLGNTDQIDTINNIDATNYIDNSGGIDLSIKHVVFVPFLAFTFESFIDQVEIVVE